MARARAPKCYCGSETVLRDGPYGSYWRCPATGCDGKVGCHPGSTKPLGTPGDAPTRAARILAHDALDSLWGNQPTARHRREWRAATYRWLGLKLGTQHPHIGEMDRETALKVAGLASRARPDDIRPYLSGKRALA